MNNTASCHPSEEILTGCALDEADGGIEEHLAGCAQCREFVEDIRMISSEIAAFDEKEIPRRLHDKIMEIAHSKKRTAAISFIQNWYKNSFFYGILTAFFAIVMYVIFTIFLQ